MRCQALDERRLNESTRRRAVVEALEVRQRTVLETVRNTLTLYVLLTQNGNHLGYVRVRALGTCLNHIRHTIVICE